MHGALSLGSLFPDGKRAAVSCTYDSVTDRHLDEVIPQLESFGVRGTFYVPTRGPTSESFHARPDDWRRAFERGHEIGNATQYWPRPRATKGVKPNFSLEAYSLARLEPELLGAIDDIAQVTSSRQPTSFAYPLGEDWVGPDRTNFRSMIARLFPAGRGLKKDATSIDPRDCDLNYLPAWRVNTNTPLTSALRAIDDAVEAGRWLILSLDVAPKAHIELIDHAVQAGAHVATVISIVRHLKPAI